MSRKGNHARRTRRIAIALGLVALAVPTAAQARPAPAENGGAPASSTYPSMDAQQAQIVQNHQSAITGTHQQGGPQLGTTGGQLKPDAVVQATVVKDGSGFSWTDALIGAAVTAGLLGMAFGGAMAVQRRGRLGYR
jgi:hypothetical protein